MPALNPPRRFLFGPGPSQVEPRVYEALAKPLVGYLDPFLYQVFDEVREGLRAVFGTRNPYTLVIPGTGSAGMETAVTNFVDPGAKFAIFVNGFFCERIAEMGRRHGAQVVRAEKPWGEVFTDAEARAFLEKERPQVVAFVHGETSTGAMQAPEAITGPAHEVGALVIADCVTTLGSVPVRMDQAGIDIAYSCSQKGLSAPPGLSPFTVSPRAVERLNARTTPNRVWYLDLKLLMEYYDCKKYHHTAPVSSFYALREALAAIQEEGVEQRHARHLKAHGSFVRRIEAMGLKMHVAPGCRLTTLNTPRVPEGVDEAQVRRQLLEEFGIEIAGGFGPLAAKIFRIGVMGPLATEPSLDLFFQAFGKCLAIPAKA
ncbi:MAG TPA: aminotransferase class V-fold PLP-dependent enzyme [Bryobacteraceae bacterium]|nr:aminotransferase class V-fold PLP-dependent enzyme [Bryobacteraceae bacterium]